MQAKLGQPFIWIKDLGQGSEAMYTHPLDFNRSSSRIIFEVGLVLARGFCMHTFFGLISLSLFPFFASNSGLTVRGSILFWPLLDFIEGASMALIDYKTKRRRKGPQVVVALARPFLVLLILKARHLLYTNARSQNKHRHVYYRERSGVHQIDK